MINEVRNTVLFMLNKDNNGYISPEQFNLYARQAQLERQYEYFNDFSLSVNKTNNHLNTTGHSDIAKRREEVIDLFTEQSVLVFNGTTLRFVIPSDKYSMGTVLKSDFKTEIDLVSHHKIPYLISSLDTTPDDGYPVYSIFGNEIQVYPSTINVTGDVIANYVRFPKDPKWTYTSITNGDPLFNPGASGYQDFELPKDDEINLIMKILLYSGVEIRDPQVIQIAQSEEIQNNQDKS